MTGAAARPEGAGRPDHRGRLRRRAGTRPRFGDALAGWVDYGRVGSRIVAFHTEVLPEFGGRGVGSALVRRVLADARAAGAKVTPRCPLFSNPLRAAPGGC